MIPNGTLYLARRTRFTESEVALYAGVASGGGPAEVLFSVKSKSELRPGFASVSTALGSLLYPATIADSGYAMMFAMRQLRCSQA